MAGQPGFFDSDERLRALSAAGDPLERLVQVVDFELFRSDLEAALSRSDRSKGGRPPYDAVVMFKVLVLQTLYTLSDDQTEYQLRDRLSFMRFVGLALHDPVPDAKTIWLYREQLACAGAAERLFARFDALLKAKGWRAMGGQIIDATVIEARRPRLTQPEKDILSRQSRNQTGGPRQNSSSAMRAILDDPPIHIRPVCSRKRGCEGQEPCGFNAFQHAHGCTPPPPRPQDSSHVLSRVSS
jgi:transposase